MTDPMTTMGVDEQKPSFSASLAAFFSPEKPSAADLLATPAKPKVVIDLPGKAPKFSKPEPGEHLHGSIEDLKAPY